MSEDISTIGEVANKTLGVRLTESESRKLQEIKTKTSVSKAKLAQIAIRRLIRDWEAEGKITL